MAQYNNDFSEEDTARLCLCAPYANDPQIRFHTCLWVTGGVVCHSHFRASEFPDHLRSHHGVVGSDKAQVVCCWVDCFAEIKIGSIMRHVDEQHLELRHVCPICRVPFTRAYTMQTHITKEHPSN